MEYAFRNTLTRFLLVLTVLALLTGTVWAQGGSGELTGLVTDPSGAVVANAPLTLSNTATGEKRTSATTPSGTYRFPALPVVGTYTLETSPKGFKSVKVANIVVSVGTVTSRDIKLELGASSEQITVEAGAQQVQTTESSLSGLVDRRVWQQMPLETRSQNEFINLIAGASPGENVVINRGAAVNGARSGTGNYLVEGFDNNDQGLGGGGALVGPGGANTTISPDAIQEYRVINHNFSAEYGKAGGFVTDTVLKSGTNQWHGSLFEYNRIQALAANSFFSNRNGLKDSLVRNQFGGSIGGPIVKDKSFFYFTTEFHRRRQNSPLTGNSTTPDFLNFVDSGAFETFMESDPNGLCVARFGGPCPGFFAPEATLGPTFKNVLENQPFPICVPGAANCSNLIFTGQSLYTGGLVYPVPIFGQVGATQGDKLNQARYSAKVDQKLTEKDQVNGSYVYDNADEATDFAGSDSTFGPPLFSHGRAMNAGISWAHTFSPTVLNQARIAFNRHTANFPGDAKAAAAGLPSIVTAFDSFAVGFGNASNLPQFFTENQFQYKDDLSITKGKHNFKTGGEYRRTRNGSSFQAEFNGLFEPYGIEDLVTDSKFGDSADAAYSTALYGYAFPIYGSWFYAGASVDPTTAQRPIYYRGYRANEVAAYAQDDWRIHPRLTLNLGVRWEYFGPPHNFKSGIDSNFFTGSPAVPFPTASTNPFFPLFNPVFAAVGTGTDQVTKNVWNKDLNNWAPRVGFAWDTFGTQKFVVRGAFGIAYDRMYNNIFENIRFNPPFFCFCGFGTFINGVPGGNLSTPGAFSVPFTTTGAFVDPTLYPGGVLPKPTPRAIDQNLVTAYYEQASFGFQYEIGRDMVLETNYVGTLGRKLIGIVNLNTFPGRTSGLGSIRPNPNLGSINFRANDFSSNYHALQVNLRKRFSRGLQFQANYTYSKALDQLSDTFGPRAQGTNPTDSSNIKLDYGPADFDLKHRVVFNFNYDLPFLNNNRFLGNWSVNGIFAANTGSPFSVYDSVVDTNRNGTFNDRVAYVGGGAITRAIHSNSPADGYLTQTDPNTGINSSFAAVNALAGGTVACPASVNLGLWCEGPSVGQSNRNSLYGPGFFNIDFGVSKSFKITESAKVQFQANFFNLLNRSNFQVPDGNLNSGTFGQSTKTFDNVSQSGGARVTQLALRFDF